MRVSFIVPVKELNNYVLETVQHLQRLDGGDWEAFVVTNDEQEAPWTDNRIAVVASGRVGPADKRDLAATIATGEILVFLDDDSYPESNLLTVLRQRFLDEHSVIGGPAVTPPDDTYWQQVSGAMYLSRLTGGAPERYIPTGEARRVADWPSVNFAIRREVFLGVGGFDCPFWPGEDTFLCDKLTKKGLSIQYEPEAVVWHHRRDSLVRHLKQVGGYGLHRGFFARKFRQSSLRIVYFAPSGLVLAVLLGILVPWDPLRLALSLLVAIYIVGVLAALVHISRLTGFRIALGVLIYAPASHFWYGIRFIQGFAFTRHLQSPLR